MHWLIGGLVLIILVLIFIMFLMYTANECQESAIFELRNENTKILSKYEHVLTQLNEYGFEIRVTYSDACHIQVTQK